MIAIIVAMARNRVIGKNNQLPWRLSNDLKHFKEVTMGSPVIMGRKTYDSIGKPLPGRENIVVTRQKNLKIEGCDVAPSLDEALKQCEGKSKIFIIGGAQLYAEALSKVDTLFVTHVDADVEGDSFFPSLDDSQWCAEDERKFFKDEKNQYPHRFVTYRRK